MWWNKKFEGCQRVLARRCFLLCSSQILLSSGWPSRAHVAEEEHRERMRKDKNELNWFCCVPWWRCSMPSSSSPSSSPSPWLSSSIYFRLQMKIEEFRSQSNQMRNVSATQQQQQMKIRIIDFVLSFYRGKRSFTLSYPLSHSTTIDVFPFEKSRKCLIMNSFDAHNRCRD